MGGNCRGLSLWGFQWKAGGRDGRCEGRDTGKVAPEGSPSCNWVFLGNLRFCKGRSVSRSFPHRLVPWLLSISSVVRTEGGFWPTEAGSSRILRANSRPNPEAWWMGRARGCRRWEWAQQPGSPRSGSDTAGARDTCSCLTTDGTDRGVRSPPFPTLVIVLCYCLNHEKGQEKPMSPYGFVQNSCGVEGVSASRASCFSVKCLPEPHSASLLASFCLLWADREKDLEGGGGAAVVLQPGDGSAPGEGAGVGLCLPSLPLSPMRQAVEPGTMRRVCTWLPGPSRSQPPGWASWRGSSQHGHG